MDKEENCDAAKRTLGSTLATLGDRSGGADVDRGVVALAGEVGCENRAGWRGREHVIRPPTRLCNNDQHSKSTSNSACIIEGIATKGRVEARSSEGLDASGAPRYYPLSILSVHSRSTLPRPGVALLATPLSLGRRQGGFGSFFWFFQGLGTCASRLC